MLALKCRSSFVLVVVFKKHVVYLGNALYTSLVIRKLAFLMNWDNCMANAARMTSYILRCAVLLVRDLCERFENLRVGVC